MTAPSLPPKLTPEFLERVNEQQRVLQAALDDYDRRRSTRRGRFLLWLLRKLT